MNTAAHRFGMRFYPCLSVFICGCIFAFMHDLSFFRSNLDSIAQRLVTRGYQLDVEQFRALDLERRSALTEAEQLKAQKNAKSSEVGKLRKDGQDTDAMQQEIRQIGDVPTIGRKPACRATTDFRMGSKRMVQLGQRIAV